MHLTTLCTAEPYFSCELGIYQQNEGTPMGGPLSSLLADLVLENKVEATIKEHPKWGNKWDWVRKADDTFMEWTGSSTDLDDFYEYLNDIHPTIKWSREIEHEGTIPFLDVMVIRSPIGIQTTVYRKPSASDRYTHFTTAQAWREKIITITTLRQRAEGYCSTEDLKTKELQHLETTFTANGYPTNIIQRYLYQHKPPNNTTIKEEKQTHFYAPYHPLAHKLFRKLHKRFNISPLYQKTKTLTNILYHSRPPQQPIHTPGAVYAIPCNDCSKHYIGETKRPTTIRLEEEQRDLKQAKQQPNKKFSDEHDFGYVQQYKETGHQFNFINTKILQLEAHYHRRKLAEGIYIKLNKEHSCNLKAGAELDKCWLPLLTTMKKFKIAS